MNILNTIALVAAGGAVRRFHTQDTVRENTVGHHSFGVGWFCYMLTGGRPGEALLLHALAHDLAECVVGDVPAPTKKLQGIGAQMDSLEEDVMAWAGLNPMNFPAISAEEARVLKLADAMDGFLFTIMEVRRGNEAVRGCLLNYGKYVARQVVEDREAVIYAALQELEHAVDILPGQSGVWFEKFIQAREPQHAG